MSDYVGFQKKIRSTILRLKSQAYGRIKLHGDVDGIPYDLIPITRDCQNDDGIVALFSKWRKKHEKWFPAQFPVTVERTRVWLGKRVIDEPDRLLFLIEARGTYIGHVGLYRFNFKRRRCDIDNIVRGRPGVPGLMEHAVIRMMAWGRKYLGLVGYTLQTTSDNEKAIRLYKRLGFVVVAQTPLVYRKTKEGGGWIKAPAGYTKRVARFEVHMKQIQHIRPSHKKIAFAGPSITNREVRYAIDAVKHGWYQTFDKHIKKLEAAMASYIGTNYALAGFCATHCMHLACLVCGFKKGDEVIVTDFSWAATAHVIAYTGATPVFVDIDPDTWCIDPKAIERAITKKTKGIMLVHSFGMPADMDAIMGIARKYKLKVVEDAAPALGSVYKGKKVGGIGDVGCVSFHGAKIAVSGEGGMFLTNNKRMLEEAILQSNMGRTDRLANF